MANDQGNEEYTLGFWAGFMAQQHPNLEPDEYRRIHARGAEMIREDPGYWYVNSMAVLFERAQIAVVAG